MYVRIEIKIHYKDGTEEKHFPKFLYFSEGNLCLSFCKEKTKIIRLSEVEQFNITQDFGAYGD